MCLNLPSLYFGGLYSSCKRESPARPALLCPALPSPLLCSLPPHLQGGLSAEGDPSVLLVTTSAEALSQRASQHSLRSPLVIPMDY